MQRSKHHHTSNRLLLLVDDDAGMRSSIAGYLEDIGYRVLEAENGCAALALLAANKPDIIFTDLRMPGMDGHELIRQIREQDTETPIIVISGNSALDDAVEALRLGAWDYIRKPIHDFKALEIITNRALEKAALLRENHTYREQLETLLTKRTNQLQESRTLKRRLSQAINQSGSIVMMTDINGIIEYVNPQFVMITDYAADEVIGRNANFLKSGYHPESCYRELWETISSGKVWHGELCNCRKNGEQYWVQMSITPVRNQQQELTGFLAVKEDITRRKGYEARLYSLANYDTLTGLPNLNLLKELFIQRLAASPGNYFLLLLDLDNFKFLNDTLGHGMGDQALILIAARIEQALGGSGALLARQSGDEFILLVPASDPLILPQTLYCLESAFIDAFLLSGHEVFLRHSIGIACYPDDGTSLETLLQKADAGMYHAKATGKNSTCFYFPQLGERARLRLTMESQLRKALQQGEFLLHYQPQVDAKTSVPTGMEALVRWSRDGSPELVQPADFIPILEDTGLIIQLGEWILQQACRQYMIWKMTIAMPDLQLSVNISARQFSTGSFPATVAKALAASGMPPHLLCLELTENIVMQDLPSNLQILKKLNSMGVKLSIDDFGTGYSSLSYLRRLPINELKIDRSFITSLPADFHDAAIVSTIVGMAHYLKIQVVAEGVENDGQGQFLALQGCHVLQGYLHSRPLAPDALEQWLKSSLINEIHTLLVRDQTTHDWKKQS